MLTNISNCDKLLLRRKEMGGLKFGRREYSYSMLESAKLMCQYKDLVEEALGFNESFKVWYNSLSDDDLELMERDQESRKAKQAAKKVGKTLGFLAGMFFGYASYSKSPTKEIAENAVYDNDIWVYLIVNGIKYDTLRKIL